MTFTFHVYKDYWACFNARKLIDEKTCGTETFCQFAGEYKRFTSAFYLIWWLVEFTIEKDYEGRKYAGFNYDVKT